MLFLNKSRIVRRIEHLNQKVKYTMLPLFRYISRQSNKLFLICLNKNIEMAIWPPFATNQILCNASECATSDKKLVFFLTNCLYFHVCGN